MIGESLIGIGTSIAETGKSIADKYLPKVDIPSPGDLAKKALEFAKEQIAKIRSGFTEKIKAYGEKAKRVGEGVKTQGAKLLETITRQFDRVRALAERIAPIARFVTLSVERRAEKLVAKASKLLVRTLKQAKTITKRIVRLRALATVIDKGNPAFPAESAAIRAMADRMAAQRATMLSSATTWLQQTATYFASTVTEFVRMIRQMAQAFRRRVRQEIRDLLSGFGAQVASIGRLATSIVSGFAKWIAGRIQAALKIASVSDIVSFVATTISEGATQLIETTRSLLSQGAELMAFFRSIAGRPAVLISEIGQHAAFLSAYQLEREAILRGMESQHEATRLRITLAGAAAAAYWASGNQIGTSTAARQWLAMYARAREPFGGTGIVDANEQRRAYETWSSDTSQDHEVAEHAIAEESDHRVREEAEKPVEHQVGPEEMVHFAQGETDQHKPDHKPHTEEDKELKQEVKAKPKGQPAEETPHRGTEAEQGQSMGLDTLGSAEQAAANAAQSQQAQVRPPPSYRDGQLTGPFLPPGKNFPPYRTPEEALRSGNAAVYVNGIKTASETHARAAQDLANKIHKPVVGVYNATEGAAADFAQCIADKLGVGGMGRRNPATNTLRNVILAYGNPRDQQGGFQVFAHSQGSIILSEAIREARAQGGDISQLDVTTFGNAAWTMPEGLKEGRYHHYSFDSDVVSTFAGSTGPIGAMFRSAPMRMLLGALGFRSTAQDTTIMHHPGSFIRPHGVVPDVIEGPDNKPKLDSRGRPLYDQEASYIGSLDQFRELEAARRKQTSEGGILGRLGREAELTVMPQRSLSATAYAFARGIGSGIADWIGKKYESLSTGISSSLNQRGAGLVPRLAWAGADYQARSFGRSVLGAGNLLSWFMDSSGPPTARSYGQQTAIQRQGTGPDGAVVGVDPARLRAQIGAAEGAGRLLPTDLRMELGPYVGFDPSRARVHVGPAAAKAARDLQAAAFTIGEDVYFGAGMYRPQSPEGRALLAHELTHVAQQSHAGIQRHTRSGGDAMEREAQATAERVLAGSRPHEGRLIVDAFLKEYQPNEEIPAEIYGRLDRIGDMALRMAGEGCSPTVVEQPVGFLEVQVELDVANLTDEEAASKWAEAIRSAIAPIEEEAAHLAGEAAPQAIQRQWTTPDGRFNVAHLNMPAPLPRPTQSFPDDETEEYELNITIMGEHFGRVNKAEAMRALRNTYRWIRGQVEAGAESHLDYRRMREEHWFTGGVSDFFGGVSMPSLDIWLTPAAILREAHQALTNRNIPVAFRALARAREALENCQRRIYEYREGSIRGAERTVTGLEVTRDVSAITVGVLATAATGGAAATVITAGYGATQQIAQQGTEVALGMRDRIDWGGIAINAVVSLIVGRFAGRLGERFAGWAARSPAVTRLVGRLISSPATQETVRRFATDAFRFIIIEGRGSASVTRAITTVIDRLRGQRRDLTWEQLIEEIAREWTDPRSYFYDLLGGYGSRWAQSRRAQTVQAQAEAAASQQRRRDAGPAEEGAPVPQPEAPGPVPPPAPTETPRPAAPPEAAAPRPAAPETTGQRPAAPGEATGQRPAGPAEAQAPRPQEGTTTPQGAEAGAAPRAGAEPATPQQRLERLAGPETTPQRVEQEIRQAQDWRSLREQVTEAAGSTDPQVRARAQAADQALVQARGRIIEGAAEAVGFRRSSPEAAPEIVDPVTGLRFRLDVPGSGGSSRNDVDIGVNPVNPSELTTPQRVADAVEASRRLTGQLNEQLRARSGGEPDVTLDTNVYANPGLDARLPVPEAQARAVSESQQVGAFAEMRRSMTPESWAAFRRQVLEQARQRGEGAVGEAQRQLQGQTAEQLARQLDAAEAMSAGLQTGLDAHMEQIRRQNPGMPEQAVRQRAHELAAQELTQRLVEALRVPEAQRDHALIAALQVQINLMQPGAYASAAGVASVPGYQQPLARGTSADYMSRSPVTDTMERFRSASSSLGQMEAHVEHARYPTSRAAALDLVKNALKYVGRVQSEWEGTQTAEGQRRGGPRETSRTDRSDPAHLERMVRQWATGRGITGPFESLAYQYAHSRLAWARQTVAQMAVIATTRQVSQSGAFAPSTPRPPEAPATPLPAAGAEPASGAPASSATPTAAAATPAAQGSPSAGAILSSMRGTGSPAPGEPGVGMTFRVRVGDPIDRGGAERQYYSGSEPRTRGGSEVDLTLWDRGHVVGPGFGVETGEGLVYVPRELNRSGMGGIEPRIRDTYAQRPEGATIEVTITRRAWAGTQRLAHAHYVVERVNADGSRTLLYETGVRVSDDPDNPTWTTY